MGLLKPPKAISCFQCHCFCFQCIKFSLDIKTQIDLNRTNPMCETFKQLNPLKIYNFNNTFSVKEPYVRVLLFFLIAPATMFRGRCFYCRHWDSV